MFLWLRTSHSVSLGNRMTNLLQRFTALLPGGFWGDLPLFCGSGPLSVCLGEASVVKPRYSSGLGKAPSLPLPILVLKEKPHK